MDINFFLSFLSLFSLCFPHFWSPQPKLKCSECQTDFYSSCFNFLKFTLKLHFSKKPLNVRQSAHLECTSLKTGRLSDHWWKWFRANTAAGPIPITLKPSALPPVTLKTKCTYSDNSEIKYTSPKSLWNQVHFFQITLKLSALSPNTFQMKCTASNNFQTKCTLSEYHPNQVHFFLLHSNQVHFLQITLKPSAHSPMTLKPSALPPNTSQIKCTSSNNSQTKCTSFKYLLN